MDEKYEVIRQKQQEIINLQCDLKSTVSSVGDWKVIKCYEASLQSKDMPYDVDTLIADRQAVRDKINTLQEEIAALEQELANA